MATLFFIFSSTNTNYALDMVIIWIHCKNKYDLYVKVLNNVAWGEVARQGASTFGARKTAANSNL